MPSFPGSIATPPCVLMTADAVGGVWSYCLALCRALPEIRFVLAVMGPPPGEAQRRCLLSLDNVILEASGYRLEWMAGAEEDFARSRDWLLALAKRHCAELLHINGYAHAVAGAERPVIVVAHSDVLSWWRAVHGTNAPPEWEPYHRRLAAGVAAANRIVAPSAAALADLARHCPALEWPRRRRIIPNGIAFAAFPPLSKREVVLAAGRVWDRAKNLADLDAVAAGLPWPVEIAGDAAHPEGGAAALRKACLLGRLDAAAMAEAFGRAAIFAAPARYEPFGLAILEAAAAQCALVLGDIPSLREHWEGSALFVDPDDPARLRAAITSLIADPENRGRLAAAARRRARSFTIERMADAYRAFYRELLRQSAELEPA